MGWATFWAIFFTNSSGHPGFNQIRRYGDVTARHPVKLDMKLLLGAAGKNGLKKRILILANVFTSRTSFVESCLFLRRPF
jgi:hypothetical protein